MISNSLYCKYRPKAGSVHYLDSLTHCGFAPVTSPSSDSERAIIVHECALLAGLWKWLWLRSKLLVASHFYCAAPVSSGLTEGTEVSPSSRNDECKSLRLPTKLNRWYKGSSVAFGSATDSDALCTTKKRLAITKRSVACCQCWFNLENFEHVTSSRQSLTS